MPAVASRSLLFHPLFQRVSSLSLLDLDLAGKHLTFNPLVNFPEGHHIEDTSVIMMQSEVAKFPRPNDIHIQYGTAGFRTKSEVLDHIVFRMGILAALRSRAKNSSAIGLMITASHNPEPDNGVKLVDPHGEMLEMEWEATASRLANAPDSEFLVELSNVTAQTGVDVGKPALVYVGRDTRSSSERLAKAALAGIKAFQGTAVDHGQVTTPMLHYYVYAHNMGIAPDSALEESYFSKLALSFKQLREEIGSKGSNYSFSIDFDGANGVGSLAMKKLRPLIGDALLVSMHNDDVSSPSKLNNECGSDYVKTHLRAPKGFEPTPNRRIVSVDGDADRVMYSYVDSNDRFHLLDGDRIASLVAGYLMELVEESGLQLSLGLVQTAYANGNSTKYITETMKIPVACVSTGVKHLHHKALEYDIGVYFEANGHGTVVFSNNARNLVTKASGDSSLDTSRKQSIQKLKLVMDVINSTVGDAISDMLLVEIVLQARGWSALDWESAYQDLPSRLMKVYVQDRNVIETSDAARMCTKPDGLQKEIDAVVSCFKSGRSFVRASGTEDVVRVYAEAETQEDADKLAIEVARLVHNMADGVGPIPS